MPPASIQGFRSHFPIFRDRVYLNSCSQGALSDEVERALAAYLDSWRRDGSPWEEWVDETERLRSDFARFIGAEADEVAVMPSASAGINSLASCLAFSQPRDTVAMGELEFPTMTQIWLAQERRGARISWVRAEGDAIGIEAYRRVIDERTLLVPATHVCFRNGFRLDIPALSQLCRERGAYLLLDDYQHSGSGPVDVHALGVDFMVTGCLKYLLGLSGVAFLYVRRELLERLEPTITGWFGRVNPFAFSIDRLDWSPSARRFESGSPPVVNAYGSRAGLRLLSSIGLPAIRDHVSGLTGRLIERANDAGFVVSTSADPARRGPLVVIRCADAPEMVSRLKSRGIIASCRGTGLRISFHAYNTEQDVDAALSALEAEAGLLQRASAVGGRR
jgi:selenocysteine lyase/cysteine desulfurase